MKKWILLYCRERELSVLGSYDTLEEAQDAMRADFRKYHLEDLHLDEEQFDKDCVLMSCCAFDEYELGEMSAWSNADSSNKVDWKIEEIEIKPAPKLEKESESLMDRIFAGWKVAQEAGAWLPCPRCGCLTMSKDVHTNAYSRWADIYVCDDCGMLEALEAVPGYKGPKVPLENWFIGSFE